MSEQPGVKYGNYKGYQGSSRHLAGSYPASHVIDVRLLAIDSAMSSRSPPDSSSTELSTRKKRKYSHSYTHKPFFEGKDILDLGCNTGYISVQLALVYKARNVVGIDIDEELVGKAKGHARWRYSRVAPGILSKSEIDIDELKREKEEEERRNEMENGNGNEKKKEKGNENENGDEKEKDKQKRKRKKKHKENENENHIDLKNLSWEEQINFFPTSSLEKWGPLPLPNTTILSSMDSETQQPIKRSKRETSSFSPPNSQHPTFPYNLTFLTHDITSSQLPPSPVTAFNIILSLSLTKWIHLRNPAFLQIYLSHIHNLLSPSGFFVHELQPWSSYKNAIKKQKAPHLKGNFEILEEEGWGEEGVLEERVEGITLGMGLRLVKVIKPGEGDGRDLKREIRIYEKSAGK